MKKNTWLTMLALVTGAGFVRAQTPERPNIVWIVSEDQSARQFPGYGETPIATPHLDRMAKEGVRFAQAYTTAPVCSASRSALITGRYQTSIGAQHHRSGRGEQKIHLPEGVETVPELFRKAGYYVCNTGYGLDAGRAGKTDYNFEHDKTMYDGASLIGRRRGQPFFMQVQVMGGKMREAPGGAARMRAMLGEMTPVDKVTNLPPYYPRDPVVLEDWALYLDTIRYTDWDVGEVLSYLEREEVLDKTVIFFLSDHGVSHARGKQFLHDEGVHIPMVVRGPGIPAGAVRADPVEHIDVAATSLALAGIPVPAGMQGRDIFAKDYVPRDAVFAARDRCDETVDRLRAVRTSEFAYIRNLLPKRPLLQPCAYKDNKKILKSIRALHAAGKLDAVQEQLLFAPERPAEELYDLKADPWELRNLAADPEYRPMLEKLSRRLDAWMADVKDQGLQPESMAMYDSDMEAYVAPMRKRAPDRAAEIEANIQWMKRAAAEGR